MIRDEFVGDDSIVLPVTFDYKGGRAGNLKGSIIVVLVTFVAVVMLSVVIFKMGSKELYLRFIYFFILIITYVFFLRFAVFKEKLYKQYMESLSEVSSSAIKEGKEDKTSNFYWGIFDISDSYPYECYYVDGKRGIFVSLAKDIFIGKGEDVIAKHYDAVSNAFNVASRSQVDLVCIDYMDTVGNDTRMTGLYSELSYSRNEKLKSFVGSLYKGLIDSMEGEFASYDVYCVVTSNKNVELDKVMMRVVTELLEGNYVAFKVLREPEIRQLCAVLTNDEDFSLLEARERVLRVNNCRSFKPLFVVDGNNRLNMISENGEIDCASDDAESGEVSASDEDATVSPDEEFDIF